MSNNSKRKPNVTNITNTIITLVLLLILIVVTIYLVLNRTNETESTNTTIVSNHKSEPYSPIEAKLLTDEVSVDTMPQEDVMTVFDESNYTVNESYYKYLNPQDINGQYVYMVNQTTKEIVYQKGADTKCYPASTTKILTAIVALENISPDTVFTVGTELSLVPAGSSLAYIQQGEKITLNDLLYGLMLPSGNDVAYTIAVNVAKRVSGKSMSDAEAVKYFATLMNETAERIGMKDSHFVVPDGFHDANHYVTAKDMMKLLVYSQNFELIKRVASTYTYECKVASGQNYTWVNSNRLLDPNGAFYYAGVNGLKTGFHDDAGHCVAITSNINGMELYIVIMKADSYILRNYDTINLLNMIVNPSAIKIGNQWYETTNPDDTTVTTAPIVTDTNGSVVSTVPQGTNPNGNAIGF